MAYTCCGSCYQIFPTFLPKLKQCVDDFPDACDFWGKDHCSSSDVSKFFIENKNLFFKL
jgi:hypothetical protein